jgi:hypothetical protein
VEVEDMRATLAVGLAGGAGRNERAGGVPATRVTGVVYDSMAMRPSPVRS